MRPNAVEGMSGRSGRRGHGAGEQAKQEVGPEPTSKTCLGHGVQDPEVGMPGVVPGRGLKSDGAGSISLPPR